MFSAQSIIENLLQNSSILLLRNDIFIKIVKYIEENIEDHDLTYFLLNKESHRMYDLIIKILSDEYYLYFGDKNSENIVSSDLFSQLINSKQNNQRRNAIKLLEDNGNFNRVEEGKFYWYYGKKVKEWIKETGGKGRLKLGSSINKRGYIRFNS
jgi:hypothetical protein